MGRNLFVGTAIAAGVALAWHCGGTAGEDCSPECGPGFVCYYGHCVPDEDAAGEAETGADADADARPDVPVEAEAEMGGDADVLPDVEPDALPDTVPDVVPDGAPDADAVPDVEPETDANVDVRPEAEDAVPEADAPVDVRPDADILLDVRPDGDVLDIGDAPGDVVIRCGPSSSALCPEGQVCDLRSCDPTASGFCVPRPSACPPFWRPVCGCDGRTYGNDCERLAAGAALDHEGECEEPPPAAPMCVPTADGGAAWVGGDGTFICRAACLTCTASCLYAGSFSEGWYAVCSGSGTDGGCGTVPGLIEWADCAP